MTTDTAVLVSSEILESGKNFKELELTENPDIQNDENVKPFLDYKFSIETLADSNNEIYSKFENLSQYGQSETFNNDQEHFQT